PGTGRPRLPHRRGADRRHPVGGDRQPRRPRPGTGDRVPVLTRLIPSPVVVDIRPGALDGLGSVLADERISHSGKLAVAVSNGSGARLRERVAPSLPGAAWFPVGGGRLDDAVALAGAIKGDH